MLSHPSEYRVCSVIVACFKDVPNRSMRLFLLFPQRYKFILFSVLFVALSLCFNTTFADEKAPVQDAAEAGSSTLSGLELYRKAKSIRRSNRTQSVQLAHEALNKAEESKNDRLSAEVCILLGKLAREQKDVDEAILYFIRASDLYDQIGDKGNQIMASTEYANTLIAEKRYVEGDQVIDSLLLIAEEYGDDLPIALIQMTKGDGYYKQNRYKDAIQAYMRALIYLTDEDFEVQKRLALTYQKLAQAHTRLRNTDEAIDFYKKSLDVYTILDNKKSMASSLRNLATQERNRSNYEAALKYSTQGLKIQRLLGDKKALAKALSAAGIIYRYLKRYEESLAHFHEAHQLYKEGNYITEIGETSKEIGLIYTRLRKFDQARSFYQLAIDLPEKEVSPKTRGAALREIAVIDLNAGNYDSAIKMASKAYELFQKIKDPSKSSTTARIIGRIYQAQNNEDQAIIYFHKALDSAIKAKSEKDQVKALTNLGQSLVEKNVDDAIEHLKRALVLSTKLDNKDQQLSIYRSLRIAEKKRGHISESLYYAEKEIAISNVLYTQKESVDVAKAKAALDSYKMEMELDNLKEKAKLDNLKLAEKNSKIEIANQAGKIVQLELEKNRYANFTLISLLLICLVAVFFIYRRFIDSTKRNRELDYLAARDPLTNCYNRRVLFDLMNRDFSDLDSIDEYSIIMLDIDHFKEVNDTYGHSVGDEVLRGVGGILQHSVREGDITARYGGEEFCLLLPGADKTQAMNIAETIRTEVEASRLTGLTITCSFGVSSIEFNAKNPKALIEQADIALYQSKNSGRNQVNLWDPALTSSASN